MPIAISDDHLTLGQTAAGLLTARDSRGASRALLDTPGDTLPELWAEMVDLGWLGLHVPEDLGGSGYSLEELVVVIEETGRALVPGPFVPTMIASAALLAADNEGARTFVPGLADGSVVAGIGMATDVSIDGGTVSGRCGAVLGGAIAGLFVLGAGDDLVIVENGPGVTVDVPPALDNSRRSARISLDGAAATVVSGAARHLVDISRLLLAAEAVGVARECTLLAADYARDREQFGRPIAMFQAVKHHCANMSVATEMATAAVWDAARAASAGGDQFTLAAAVAAALAAPAADLCANLNTQVHGGIAITWEHDAHLYMRRATTLLHYLDATGAAEDVTDLTRQGVARAKAIELPPEAEQMRADARGFLGEVAGLADDERRNRLVESGYLVPNWPTPYGRAAGAVEQLVIEEEFAAAGIDRPSLGITAWNILTIIQHGTDDQQERWVLPALRQELTWCQLFSEPDAGSDAAGVKTKATRVDGGWLVNGQKVWTSGAHVAGMGFATIRTNPDLSKHEGITMMAIDMHGEGVEVRPLKMTTGDSGFNEVFFNDVFVPDDDVVGPVDGGWTVARSTLGNESVSIGSGVGGGTSLSAQMMVGSFDAHPEWLDGGAARIGRHFADNQAIGLLNLRAAHRAVAGGEPGPEGAMTKLVLSEIGHEAAAIGTALAGPDSVYLDGAGQASGYMMLMHRGMSIAGGTSEIKRNQIGERILGLPRDPLIR
ncbi:MAG: alkylation response protein AidB-like acyl-CoA dehydrogenase [Candidatus Aldehydirespiratoraceae bacterium]|jgi:alkylation response protein AidB-like acyl-CoA dehydrogenase